MSVVVLLGAGALIGLVALTAVVLATLLLERPNSLDHTRGEHTLDGEHARDEGEPVL